MWSEDREHGQMEKDERLWQTPEKGKSEKRRIEFPLYCIAKSQPKQLSIESKSLLDSTGQAFSKSKNLKDWTIKLLCVKTGVFCLFALLVGLFMICDSLSFT